MGTHARCLPPYSPLSTTPCPAVYHPMLRCLPPHGFHHSLNSPGARPLLTAPPWFPSTPLADRGDRVSIEQVASHLRLPRHPLIREPLQHGATTCHGGDAG